MNHLFIIPKTYLMKRNILYIILIIISSSVFSQSPGGVTGETYWLSEFKETPDLITNNKKLINFYPTKTLNDKIILEDIKTTKNLEEATVFVVMRPSFLQEDYQVFDIESENQVLSIQSDKVKSKKDLKIKNYDSDKPYFISYIESFEKKELDTLLTNKNQQKSYNSKFEGEIAEIILYPKLLSKLKRRKVETYLSLKYGISLPQNSDYINSKSDTVWKNDESKIFLYRVTGIGHDIEGNLNHKQSANVDDYQLLTIALGDKIEQKNELNKNSLSGLNYFLWADNNGALNFLENEKTPEVSILNRAWKAKIIGSQMPKEQLTISFNTDLFEIQNKEKNEESEKSDLKYWLTFASGTSDKMDLNNVEFIQSVSIPEEGGKIEFSNISIADHKDSFLFSLVKAPELFALVETKEMNCSADVLLKIKGGNAPYQVEFYDENNQKFPVEELNNKSFSIFKIPAGIYKSKITDAQNQSFEQEIIIETDSNNSFKVDRIFIKEGGSKVVDLDLIQNNTISDVVWMKNNQEIGTGTKLSIREEGEYQVNYLTEKGCSQTTSFVATKIPAVEWSGIYPNPVKINEPFFVNLNNIALSEGKLTITDFSGRIVKTKTLKEGSEIYSNSFYQQGSYLITVETSTEKNQYTLIVK